MLSRLYARVTAATAATRIGEDQRTVPEERDVASDEIDRAFDGFLQSLQNGSAASALPESP